MLELDPRIRRREPPIDGCAHRVPVSFPCRHLGAQGRLVRNAPIQTLATEHAQFNLCHNELRRSKLRGMYP